MHAILALAVGAAAFGSSSSATSSEDLESIEATLDHVEEMPIHTPAGDLNLFERAGFVVPFDWECQTGTSGGVYPCPNGILRRAANTGGVSSACAKCYCERRRARDGLGGQLREVGDAVSALYDDGESYSATVTEVTGSDITVTYSDDDTSTYDLTESGSSYINFKVTRYEMADAFGVEFYSTEGDTLKVFSTGDVHFKPDNAERTVYINEQVEYEYETDVDRRLSAAEAASPATTSSSATEGDTLKVFSTGDVHFKPDNAERTVYINEQVEYEYETDVDRRLSTAEAVLGDIDLTLPIDHARLVEARYRHSDTRGGSQKPAAASEPGVSPAAAPPP
ncbi:hypothetical protein JL722_5928 [Aureococcus anophagefferens]|nr:hypothetical protein JL722_5928 [Aureococcus anophagefferens]